MRLDGYKVLKVDLYWSTLFFLIEYIRQAHKLARDLL